MVQAPFRLASDGDLPFEDAWRLVSSNPARAAGLADRGALEPGARADLVIIAPPAEGRAAMIRLALVAGRPAFNRLDWAAFA